jgi:flagellar hook assembly protein FlgD
VAAVEKLLDIACHLVQWDGKSKTGTSLPSGMYMYRLHAGNYRAVEKLLLLK